MASPAQIAANRRNALKSTGPKDTSLTRYNGLTHGLTAKHGVLPGESHEEYDAERSSWFDFLAPANPIAAALADRAFVSFWKLTRATRMERAWTYETAADIGRGVDDHAKGLIDGGMNLLARHRHRPPHRTLGGLGLSRGVGLDVEGGAPRPPAQPPRPRLRPGAAGHGG